MKKVMMIAVLLITGTLMAQRDGGPRSEREVLSPTEKATLTTKKLTLGLALDNTQSDKMYPLVLEEIERRAAFKKARKANTERPSKAERYTMENERMDARIVMQRKVKAILSDEQFKKWQKFQNKRSKNQREGRKNRPHRSRN